MSRSDAANAAPAGAGATGAGARALSTRERGFALAAARALGRDAALLCGRRSRELGAEAARLVDAAAARAAQEALGRAVPDGIERVDPSWYGAPPRARRADAAAWLVRGAYAHLVSMADGGALSSRSAGEIERLLVAFGRRRVALAFVGAPRAGLAQLCARIGEPAASELVAEVRAVKAMGPRPDEVKAAQRALFRGEDVSDGGGDAARALFLRVGAAWLGPALARDGDELQRVAQRLPRRVGELVLAGAAAPATDGERAAALALLANAAAGSI